MSFGYGVLGFGAHSGGSLPLAVDTYYFDASDAGPTDPNAVWTNDANAFDGSLVTYALAGAWAIGGLEGTGTDAPASGGGIIQVRARYNWTRITGGNPTTKFEVLYSSISLGITTWTSTSGWRAYLTLATPTGGWTWAKVQALESKVRVTEDFGGGQARLFRSEIEVTSDPSISIDTYYFDASDNGPTDAGGLWTSDANAFDGATGTTAFSSNSIDAVLDGGGTTAPTSGNTITQVRARFYGATSPAGVDLKARFHTDAQAELLGTVTFTGYTPSTWSSWIVLSVPSGGWDWTKAAALEVEFISNETSIGSSFISAAEIEVTSNA